MAAGGRSRGASGAGASRAGLGLRLLAAALGVFFVALATDKIGWLTDGNILRERFGRAVADARPAVRWYLETIVFPGAPLFARLVPLAECVAGLALLLGFWPRIGAGLALFLVLNVHFADGSYWHVAFLRNGYGLPVIGGLLALVVSGRNLPWSVKP